MSLILDALKKLEREKQTTPRGFLVVAPRAWAGPGSGVAFVGGALAVGLVLGALGLAAYSRWSAKDVPAAPPPSTASSGAVSPPSTLALPAAAPRQTTVPETRTPTPPPRTHARNAVADGGKTTTDRAAAPAPADAASLAPSPSPTVPASPRLHAISQQDGRPVAVIDERLVHEGDEIEGMKVVRIGAAEVEIEIAGRRQILRF